MRRQRPQMLTAITDSLIALMLAISAVVWANDLHMPPGTIEEVLGMRVTLLNAAFSIVFAVLWKECAEAAGLYENTFSEWLRAALRAAAACGTMTCLLALYLIGRNSQGPIATILPAFFVSSFVYQLM